MKIPDKVFWKLCDHSGNEGGWVSPDGTYVSCGFAGHEIVGEILSAWLSPDTQPDSLTDLGWALINTGGRLRSKMRLYLPKRGLTQAQKNTMFDNHPKIYSELINHAENIHTPQGSTRHFYGYALESFLNLEVEVPTDD